MPDTSYVSMESHFTFLDLSVILVKCRELDKTPCPSDECKLPVMLEMTVSNAQPWHQITLNYLGGKLFPSNSFFNPPI